MRIEHSQVNMASSHTKIDFFSTSTQIESFRSNIDEGEKVKATKNRSHSNTLSSDKIIQELSNAIMRNLFILSQRGIIDKVDLEFTQVEKESLNFQTQAFIQTDKKEITLDVDVNLKRSFISKINLSVEQQVMLMDPLIISLNGSMPSLGDKTFKFDIDSDGKSDQISSLGKNSAFLALDKNENGKIDDGNELFGTKSGDGFGDLRLYDKDGNNWIDENDKIFDKLRIWQKTDNGDNLISIGEAGIGAIFLGNTQTSFDLKNDDNTMLGKMRSSGFFLYENGSHGLISQVDLATKDTQSPLAKSLAGLSSLQDTFSPRSENTMLNILDEKIKQMEVELIKTSNEDKIGLENQIFSMKEKFEDLRKLA